MNNIETPLVSIIITNYNREKTIATAIESALAQDYSNLEIIISDNCSTDNSVNVIKTYVNDFRVHFFQNEKNIGMLGNFKICFEERAQGEYVTIVNSDDQLINPCFISQSIQLINDNDNVSIVKSGYLVSTDAKDIYNKHDNLNEFYESKEFIKRYNHEIDLCWMGILMRRDIFKLYNFFDNNIISSDHLISAYFLLHGNICFNKHFSYKLNFSQSSASSSAFNEQQVHLIFSEYEIFFNTAENLLQIEMKGFRRAIHFYLIKVIIEIVLSHNRKQFFQISKLLKSKNKPVYLKYIYSLRFIKLYILYFFPSLGFTITKLRNKFLK